ncbi:polysaccharide pyruvyl transferase family protein [Neorhizobium sp. JUb45]|uniref:polysaccharide pyruvyl transferase family protein n=1 Tax=unclassified Neorhizobium TaxID=2629175 RepID=UPI00140505F0|nr:polysaccharide pyruvyl transferase family protein [Neorhizobium sp. JUb45]
MVANNALPRAIFFFSANTQYENAGDALINRELLKVLRRWGRVRVAQSGAPEAFIKQLRLEPQELHYESRPALWLGAVLAGTKARFSRTERPYLALTPGDPGGFFDRDVMLRGALMLMLTLAGVRIVRLGVSLGRMSRGRLRFEAFMSRFYAHIGIRDSNSLDLARTYGFRNCGYFPDFALALDPTEGFSKVDHHFNIAVSLRDDNLGQVDRAMLVTKLDQVIDAVSVNRPVSLHFVAQVGLDDAFARYLKDRYAGRIRSVMSEEQNIDRLTNIYSRADLIVSNRLHALLLASACGAVPLGLLFPESNVKIVGLLGDLGLGDHWLNPNDETLPDIAGLMIRQKVVQAAFTNASQMICYRAEALFGS